MFRLAALASLLLAVFIPIPVGAETPIEVTEGASSDGVYLGTGGEQFDQDALAAVVARAQRLGIRLIIAAPRVAEPGLEAFALRVRQDADIDAAIVFGPDGDLGASVMEDLDQGFARAVEAADAAPTPTAAADAFVTELMTERERTLPGVVGTMVKAIIVLLVVLGLLVLVEQFIRQRRAQSRAA